MTRMTIRDVSLNVKVIGKGYPLVLMHGGPSADLYTLAGFKPLADEFTLVFYDHRCNGRSEIAPLESFTWENLTADADALRQALGFDRWAVLGHSFGGYVALEYALRYPQNLSHLVLLDTGGDHHWPQQNAPRLLAQRGFSPEIVELTRRFFNGEVEPGEVFTSLMKLSKAYDPYLRPSQLPQMLINGLQSKLRPETYVYAANHLVKDWTAMDRLGAIQAPTLVMAGRDDFLYPPEHQQELAAAIPDARLVLIDKAGHNPHDEQPQATLTALRDFMRTAQPVPA